MRTVLRVCVALSLAACGAGLLRSEASGDNATPVSRTWKRVPGPAFEVVGNASAYDLRRTADEMEKFRQSLRVMFPGVRTEGASPTRVVVFRDDGALTPFKPRRGGKPQDNVIGYFTPAPDGNYMVLAPLGGEFTYRVIFHEFTHYIVRLNLPNAPMWLHEGLAEFYSTFAGSRQDGRSVLGRPLPDRAAMLHHYRLIPLSVLLSPDGRKIASRTTVGSGLFYAESWALVHYLLLGEQGRHRPGLRTILEQQQRGGGVSEPAFTAAFGMTFKEMEEAMVRHVSQNQIPAIQVPDPQDAEGRPKPEPLPEVDAQQVQGALLIRMGQTAQGEKFLQKALAIDPKDVRTRLSLAQCRMVEGRYREALDIVEPVATSAPGNFAAQWLHGEALRQSEQFAAAVGAYRRAVALNPQEPSSYFGAAIAQMASAAPGAEETFASLLRLDPNPSWHSARMYEAWLAGRNDLALADGLEYLEKSAWESDGSIYVALAVALEYQRRNRSQQAAAVLSQAAEHAGKKNWLADLVAYVQGRNTLATLFHRADSTELQTEAHAYAGLKASVEGRREEALTHLRWVEEKGNRAFVEHKLARGELKRLGGGGSTPTAQGDAR